MINLQKISIPYINTNLEELIERFDPYKGERKALQFIFDLDCSTISLLEEKFDGAFIPNYLKTINQLLKSYY